MSGSLWDYSAAESGFAGVQRAAGVEQQFNDLFRRGEFPIHHSSDCPMQRG
jgi:hypothetical protein